MIVGFTGTRRDPTLHQVGALVHLLTKLRPAAFLHGACVGSDEHAAQTARSWNETRREMFGPGSHAIRIVALPGKSASGPDEHDLQSRPALELSDEVRPVATHFARNRAIVSGCDVLVAFPGSMQEEARGGTWYTVNYARKVGRRLAIVWPDGRVAWEGEV